MSKNPPSFTRIDYSLRPAKQVERRLLIEALHWLGGNGYQIPKYTYLGMGSIYYWDFILFHKYLYISKMISAESNLEYKKRMRFNRPFPFVRLHFGAVSEVISAVHPKKPYFCWLDYDNQFDHDKLNDVGDFCTRSSTGSIICVSLPCRSALDELENKASAEDLGRRKERELSFYREQFEPYLPSDFDQVNYLSKQKLPLLFVKILRSKIEDSLLGSDKKFFQLFNFQYRDGMAMVTLGGIIETQSKVDAIKRAKVQQQTFFNDTEAPTGISVPHLTMREKLWLDQNSKSRNPCFEIDEEELKNYRQYYRQYPEYREVIS